MRTTNLLIANKMLKINAGSRPATVIKSLLVLTGLIVLATNQVACVKKRPVECAQGQCINLTPADAIDTWKHSITTGKALFTPNNSVSENPVEVHGNLSEIINNFPIVEYKTDSDLLGEDLPLRARPNSKYEIRYELGDSLLRVLKVAQKSDLPSEEWPIAVELEDGLLGVPMVGYQVQYFNTELQLNQDRRQTSTIVEVPVKTRGEARYVRVNRFSRQVFEAVQKVDVYPVQFFEGEWYYQMTVVETPTEQTASINQGGLHSLDTQMGQASKVRISFANRNALLGVNLDQDARLAENEMDQGYVFSIPITRKDFEVARVGKGFGLKEQKNERVSELDRPYVHVKFEEHFSPGDLFSSSPLGFLLGMATGDQKLVEVKLSKDYFSFTLLKANQGLKLRYAFKRVIDSGYKDVRHFSERDFNTFGYFYTTPKTLITRDLQRRGDLESLAVMNRFNPDRREIVYHFSKESVKEDDPRSGWARELARYAIHFWDQAFQKAGTNIRIRLDESYDVDLGDIRYNVIHLVDPYTFQGLGGYGPSIADSSTGEIVSATTNVIISTYTDLVARDIRNEIAHQVGQLWLTPRNFSHRGLFLGGQSSLSVGSTFLAAPSTNSNLVDLSGPRGSFFHLEDFADIAPTLKKYLAEPQLSPHQEHLLRVAWQIQRKGSTDSLNSKEKIRAFHDLAQDPVWGAQVSTMNSLIAHNHVLATGGMTSMDFLRRRIESSCPEVAQFIAQVKAASGDYNPQDEIATVEACTAKLARLSLLSVILHELGHNFSLRHNFMCSADPGQNGSNFWTADEIRKEFTGFQGLPFPEEFLPFNHVGKSSCVMDYTSEQGELPVPGKYDIAAIRYIYAGQVESVDGQLLSLKKQTVGSNELTAQSLRNRSRSSDRWASIDDVVGDDRKLLRAFNFCTDGDAWNGIDALCRLHDYGETPEEVVDHVIDSFWKSVYSTRYTFDRLRTGPLVISQMNRGARHFEHLKMIYDQWRFYLSKFVGPRRGYLDNLSEEDYQKLMTEMSQSNFKREYALFKPARDKIVKFLFEIAFLSDRYCLGRSDLGSVKTMELSTATELIGFHGFESGVGCNDPAIRAVLGAEGIRPIESGDYVEVGDYYKGFRFSRHPRAATELPDVWGLELDRLMAAQMFFMRATSSAMAQSSQIVPALMDEPDVRAEFTQRFGSRIINGTDLNANLRPIYRGRFAKLANASQQEPLFAERFKLEEDLLAFMGRQLPRGYTTPNQVVSPSLSAFSVRRSANAQEIQHLMQNRPDIKFFQDPSGRLLYAFPENSVAYSFFAVREEVENRKEVILSGGLPDQSFQNQMLELFNGFFPAEGQGRFTILSLFEMFANVQAIVGNPQVSPPARFLIEQWLSPFEMLLSRMPDPEQNQLPLGARFANYLQLRSQALQSRQQRTQAQPPGAAQPPGPRQAAPESTPPLAEQQGPLASLAVPEVERNFEAAQAQLGRMDLTPVFQRLGFPKSSAETKGFFDAVTQQAAARLDIDPDELQAQEDLILQILMSW